VHPNLEVLKSLCKYIRNRHFRF